MSVENPALQAFISHLQGEFLLGQALIRPHESAYELRHADDASLPAAELEAIPVEGLRARAQFTAEGAYRPLKSAPNLARGWRCAARSAEELGSALNHLYPGAVADWFAAQAPEPPVTHFREFTARQSGMYRIAAMLDDRQSAAVARSCCDARFCLKRRLWTTPGLPPEEIVGKSVIPCLEPCALLLELARTAMRLEQAERLPFALGPAEAETLKLALAAALSKPRLEVREGDISSPGNPRRIRLLLDRLESGAGQESA
jgi:hypothetical protein